MQHLEHSPNESIHAAEGANVTNVRVDLGGQTLLVIPSELSAAILIVVTFLEEVGVFYGSAFNFAGVLIRVGTGRILPPRAIPAVAGAYGLAVICFFHRFDIVRRRARVSSFAWIVIAILVVAAAVGAPGYGAWQHELGWTPSALLLLAVLAIILCAR